MQNHAKAGSHIDAGPLRIAQQQSDVASKEALIMLMRVGGSGGTKERGTKEPGTQERQRAKS